MSPAVLATWALSHAILPQTSFSSPSPSTPFSTLARNSPPPVSTRPILPSQLTPHTLKPRITTPTPWHDNSDSRPFIDSLKGCGLLLLGGFLEGARGELVCGKGGRGVGVIGAVKAVVEMLGDEGCLGRGQEGGDGEEGEGGRRERRMIGSFQWREMVRGGR